MLKLQQRFQQLEPSPTTQSHLAVNGGRLVGNQIEMVVEGIDPQPATLTGEVNGDRLLVGLTREGVTRRYVGSPL